MSIRSPASIPLAYEDEKFLESDDARPLRILAEYLGPMHAFHHEHISDTIVFFGSARLAADGPLAAYYAAARELAQRNPRAPASLVARPWLPETIVLADDDPAEIAERTRTVNAAAFLLVDGAGQPAGVLRREDIIAVLTRRRSHWWERTSRTASRPAQTRKGSG